MNTRFQGLLKCLFAAGSLITTLGADWSQGPGPNYDFTCASADTPREWSVVRRTNLKWFTKLPETGQSAPVTAAERVFVTTMKPVNRDSETGSDIRVYALSKKDGQILWEADIAGGYQTKLSAPFGDASAPSPIVKQGKVWVINPTGRLACFTIKGKKLWERNVTSVSRTQPILFDELIVLHSQVYLPDEHGHFTSDHNDAPLEKWTQLQALDAETGERQWLSECGVNMGCIPILQELNDGRKVLVVGRGGGHGPPEKPEGVSMIEATTGRTLWTLPLKGFMSTQNYPLYRDQVLVFHRGEHLWVDGFSGEVVKRQSIVDEVPICRWSPSGRLNVIETLPAKKPRSITQQSNLLVGRYHYFRAYTNSYLGRVDAESGKVEYLELPLQLLRTKGEKDKLLWNAQRGKPRLASLVGRRKTKRDLTTTSLVLNQVKNSRGLRVMGDERAQANGWGHTASPIPTAWGQDLVVPLLSGMVFVINSDVEKLNQNAVIAINDLGPLGESFTRASLTTDGKMIFAHTIQGVAAFAK